MINLYRKFLRLRSYCLALAFIIVFVSIMTFARPSAIPAWASPIDEQSSPTSVAIILDLSKSLNREHGPKRDDERFSSLLEALATFVRINIKQNEYFIVGVSSQPSLLMDWKDANSTLSEIPKLNPLPRDGATALFDACYMGINKVMQGQYSKRAILVISDGDDTISDRSFENVLGDLKDKNVPLYTIDIAYPKDEISIKLHKHAMKNLDGLASVSGGMAFHPKEPLELNEIFKTVTEKLKGS